MKAISNSILRFSGYLSEYQSSEIQALIFMANQKAFSFVSKVYSVYKLKFYCEIFEKRFQMKFFEITGIGIVGSIKRWWVVSRCNSWYYWQWLFVLLLGSMVNPFYTIGLFLYPLKTSDNLWFLGGIERAQWYEMVQGISEIYLINSSTWLQIEIL